MFDRAYEPIGPSEQASPLKRVAKALLLPLFTTGVVLAVAWWKLEAPGWTVAVNIAILLSSLLVGVLLERKTDAVKRRLSRLIDSGTIPDASDFYDALDNLPENSYEDLVNRYALGLIGPEEFKVRMNATLRPTE